MRVELAVPPEEMTAEVGQIDTTRPEGDAETLRDTVPVQLVKLVSVTVDLLVELASPRDIVAGVEEMLKSWTVVVTVVVWTSKPLVPVIVTV